MTRRALLVALAAVAALAGLVVAIPGHTARADDAPTGAVVLVGTGGISWSDVSKETTPNLWVLLRDGSSAALVVRSINDNTCPTDGWLGLSAGGRIAPARAGSGSDPAQRPCPGPPSVASEAVTQWSQYRSAAQEQNVNTRLGLLAQQVTEAGMCVRSVGPYAAAGAALPDGSIARWSDYRPEDLLVDLNACPVTLVDVGVVRDPEDVARGEAPPPGRTAQVRAIDDRIGAVLEAGPNGADFVIASLADAGATERLRMVIAKGPHFGPGTLSSGSTRQVGLAQSPDLTATVLDSVGIAVPATVQGSPLTSRSAPDNSQRRADTRLQTLRDLDESSNDVHRVVEPFFTAFGYGQLAVYLALLILWKGRLGSERSRIAWLGRGRVVAVAAGAVPVSTYLANLVPWWRFPVETLAVVVIVLAFAGGITMLALRGPWARWSLGPLAVIALVTLLVLAADIVTGARLQLSSVMGLQPVEGGRFYGMGNPTFALFATAAILLATAVSSMQVLRGRRESAAVAVGVIGGFALVIDAAPFWGADAGGPPALIPGIVSLVLAVLGLRMTVRRVLVVAGSVVGLFFLVAGLDWLRDPASRSHLGRFVGSMLDGTADDIVVRKAQQNVELLRETAPLSLLIPVALLAVIYVLARPTSWGSRAVTGSWDQAPTLRAGLVALVITLTIGFLINDSGVAIPAVGAMLAVPLLVSVSLATLIDQAAARSRSASGTRSGRRREQARR